MSNWQMIRVAYQRTNLVGQYSFCCHFVLVLSK